MGKELYIGRYQVIRELGRGGMGIVYEGTDPILDRPVAIKVLPPKKTASKKSVQRFLREARVSARLDHPHIVKIYDIGEEDGMFHIVMEYVPGDSLRDLIETEGKIDIPYMAELFAQLCNAMSYAHSQHITHRDIKPENIKVTLDNKIKVMDFGIAVLDDNHSLTATGSVMGTIAYFSPEQARGEEADYRADIYSMGIVFYEMLTKMLPFEASSLPDMLNKHLYDKPIYPTRRNPDIPKVFEDLILKCMEKVPDLRFSSASEMETIVRDYLTGQSKVQSVVKELQDDKIAVLKAELLASLNNDKTDFGNSIPNKKSSVEKVEAPTSSTLFKKDKTFYTVEKYKNVDYTPTVMPINPSAALSSLMAEVEEEQKQNASIVSTVPEINSSELKVKKEEPKEEPPKMSKMQQMKEAEAKKKEAEAKKLEEEKKKQESIDTDDNEDLNEESLVLPIIPQATPMVAEKDSEVSDKNNYNNYIDRMKKDASEYKGDFEFSGGSIICPHCGQENVVGQLACSRCNADLSSISQNSLQAEYANSRGLKFLESGDYSEALEQFEIAKRANPDYSQPYYNIGKIWLEQNDMPHAFRAFSEAMDMFPDDPDSGVNLAEYYRRNDEPGEAVKYYLIALRLDQNNVKVREALASLYTQQGNVAQAIKEYGYILAIDPDYVEAHKQLGYLYSSINQIDSAIKEFETVLKYEPENSQIYAWLGDLYKKKRKFGQAERNYSNAINLNPDNPDLYTSLSDLYIRENRDDLAYKTIGNALSIEENNKEARLQLADMYLERGDTARAAAELEHVVLTHPGDTDIHRNLGDLYMTMGAYDNAMTHYEKSVEADSDSTNAEAHNKLGMLYLKKDYTQLGIMEYRQAVQMNPVNPEYREDLGMAYYCHGDKARAIDELKKAATLDSRNVDYYKAIGVMMEEEGRFEEAIQMLKKAETLSPRDSQIPALIGKVYFTQGLVSMAIIEYKKALNLQPTNYLYYIYIAKAYAKKKQPDMAISSFKQALNLMPSKKVGEYGSVMAKAYIDSARSAIDNGEFTKAKQLLISAEKLVSDNVTVSHLLGVISIHEKKGRQAYDYLVKALKAQPANANILVDFARANILIGDYENALRTWNAVKEMAPDRDDLYPLKIDIFVSAGRFTEANALIDKLLKQNPDKAYYYHSLKAYLAHKKKDYLMEEKERIEAMNLSGGKWHYTKDYVNFLISRNRSDEAEPYLNSALETCESEKDRDEILALKEKVNV